MASFFVHAANYSPPAPNAEALHVAACEVVAQLEVEALEGLWLHSNGGHITIRRQGEALHIDNPVTGLRVLPISEVIQADGLHFFEHRGIFSNGIITWSNGATWTRQSDTPCSQKSSPQIGSSRIPADTRTHLRKDNEPRYFIARGQVQNVMFRQTLMRAFAKRNIRGGASNSAADNTRVDITCVGPALVIDELMSCIREGVSLNSWGARAHSLAEEANGIEIAQHQVSTDNVDKFSWNPDVEMYI